MSRYICGPKSREMALLPAKWFATRDAAIMFACDESKRTELHHYVVDTEDRSEVGWGTEGRFVWALNG